MSSNHDRDDPVLPEPVEGGQDVRDLWLGAKEVARELGMSRVTLWRYTKAGRIKMLVMGSASRPQHKYHRKDVDELRREMEEERRDREASRSPRSTRRQEAANRRIQRMLRGEINLELDDLLEYARELIRQSKHA